MQLSKKKVHFDFSGLQVASLEDPSGSTGATLFFFPKGAVAQVDIRGGSAATSETSLLASGSYSSLVDGILFAGGSTMGLAAADGVREALFKSKGELAADFNNIPSIPAAVVYDFGTRIYPGQDKLVYPDRLMGLELVKHLSSDSFFAGRAGAGVTTTANKISKKIWGGQGLAWRDLGYCKVLSAVVLNPAGNVDVQGIEPLNVPNDKNPPVKTNTTLSITVVDVPLSENQLQRLAVMVHTSMARSIFPFQSFSDGDAHFSASTRSRPSESALGNDQFMQISIEAANAMKDAIHLAAKTANGVV